MSKYLILFTFCFFIASCDFDEQIDPNNPSVDGILVDATIAQLNNLVIGTLSQMRPEINNFYDVTGIIGREIYRFSGSDPRWVSDLLSGTLDNNAFYTTRNWGDRYQTIKNCNLLIQAAENTGVVTDANLEGYLGFAKTIQANEFMIILLQQHAQIRIQVVEPDALGPLVSREAGFNHVKSLLNEAQTHLNSAGDEFAFTLTSGFNGFDTPTSFLQFNRGLTARVSANLSQWSDVLSATGASFLNVGGDLTAGPKYSFAVGGGDQPNPIFLPLNNSGENRLAHPSFLSDIEAGDTRINKVTLRDEPVTNTNLTGDYDVSIYSSNASSIPIIKNEELILLRAEAQMQLGEMAEAVSDINIIRNAYGLADYSGTLDQASVLNELLHQRRYSLFYEGHRWNDLIRYNKTTDLPLDRAGDIVHTVFPVPFDDNF